jgi:hypothetical protein
LPFSSYKGNTVNFREGLQLPICVIGSEILWKMKPQWLFWTCPISILHSPYTTLQSKSNNKIVWQCFCASLKMFYKKVQQPPYSRLFIVQNSNQSNSAPNNSPMEHKRIVELFRKTINSRVSFISGATHREWDIMTGRLPNSGSRNAK